MAAILSGRSKNRQVCEPQRIRADTRVMDRPWLVVAGVVLAVLGLLFTLQGIGVLKGSSMSNTTTWTVAGPVIVVVGLALAAFGVRGRRR
jgi:hypothetical protein